MLLFLLLISFVAIAAGLAWFLIASDHGEKEPVGMLWGAVGTGLLGCVIAVLLESWLLPLDDQTASLPIGAALTTSLGVGLIEELAKFLPLALLLWPKRYFNEYTDGVIYFALAGIGFGLPENLLYTLQFGAQGGMARMIFTPVFHAAVTALPGFWLVKQKLSGRSPVGVLPALVLAMMLHALYDFGMLSGVMAWTVASMAISVALTVSIFVLYREATEEDEESGRSPQASPLPVETPAGRRSSSVQALLSVVFGLVGIVGALFMALASVVLGVLGLVLGTLAAGSKRRLSTAGMVVSCLAIVVGLGAIAYAFSQPARGVAGAPLATGQTIASSVETPCYGVDFIDTLTITNSPSSCNLNAYNGATLSRSTDVYKVFANRAAQLSPENFDAQARAALENDVHTTLHGFAIVSESSGTFAGGRSYTVAAQQRQQGYAVTEMAVLHPTPTGSNFFVLVHARKGSEADMHPLEGQWQWR